MALVEDGRARLGETLQFPLIDKVVRARIVEPVFYDKEGARQNV
jgi:sarcosine oxidase subunit alpha